VYNIYIIIVFLKGDGTHNSMALFQLMIYPDSVNDSKLTMCTLPRSVPMYSHLLWNGR